jgi:hypothetical protein
MEETDENHSSETLPTDEVIKNAVFEWLENVDASTVTKKDLKNQVTRNKNERLIFVLA